MDQLTTLACYVYVLPHCQFPLILSYTLVCLIIITQKCVLTRIKCVKICLRNIQTAIGTPNSSSNIKCIAIQKEVRFPHQVMIEETDIPALLRIDLHLIGDPLKGWVRLTFSIFYINLDLLHSFFLFIEIVSLLSSFFLISSELQHFVSRFMPGQRIGLP